MLQVFKIVVAVMAYLSIAALIVTATVAAFYSWMD